MLGKDVDVKMNKNLLISKMKLFGDTQKSLAEYLGISLTRLNEKINETDGAEFRKREITLIKIRYNLTAEEVDQIFFNHESPLKVEV